MSTPAAHPVRIATRASALALAQSALVAAMVRAGGIATELVTATTTGDTDRRELTEIGGAGVFVGEVRAAVLAGRADIAVHSMKDLPVAPAPGLVLAAVPVRADVADVLVLRAPAGGGGAAGAGGDVGDDGSGPGPAALLAGLPPGARVGTGSPRRAAELAAVAALAGLTLDIVAVRGNVDTRLRLVVDGTVDAVVLAAAGLDRLGRSSEPVPGLLARRLPPALVLPAPAQGALAVECGVGAPDWLRAALAPVEDPATRAAVEAERAVLIALDAGCLTPVGALAEPAGRGRLQLRACLAGPDGRLHRTSVAGPVLAAGALGAQAGIELAGLLVGSSGPELRQDTVLARSPS